MRNYYQIGRLRKLHNKLELKLRFGKKERSINAQRA